MAKMEVNSTSNLQESVQGQPVSNQNQVNSMNQPMKKTVDKSNQQVISSTQLPSEVNNEGKKNPKDMKKGSEENGKSTEMKKPSHWWIWLLIIIFVLGGAAAAYFLLLR